MFGLWEQPPSGWTGPGQAWRMRCFVSLFLYEVRFNMKISLWPWTNMFEIRLHDEAHVGGFFTASSNNQWETDTDEWYLLTSDKRKKLKLFKGISKRTEVGRKVEPWYETVCSWYFFANYVNCHHASWEEHTKSRLFGAQMARASLVVTSGPKNFSNSGPTLSNGLRNGYYPLHPATY